MAQPERIEEVYLEAISRHGKDRDDYVRRACAGDSELLAEVNRYLKYHDSGDTPLPIARPPIRSLTPGQKIERFEIIDFISHGGMGEVYEADDPSIGEHVALKTLLPELLADQEMLKRFKREIVLSRRVTHKNVCRIHGPVRGRIDGRDLTGYTMELLTGKTLGSHLAERKRFSVQEALPLIRQLTNGLDALHEAEIVHRDFKPGNIFLCPQGDTFRVVITDFGLARSVKLTTRTQSVLTTEGRLLGTWLYMAPEQFGGDPDTLGPATDIYALGLVIYEMVVGERPFPAQSESESAFKKGRALPAQAIEQLNALGDPWKGAILHCLEPDPRDRPQVATHVSDVLEGKSPLRKRKGLLPAMERILAPSNGQAVLSGSLLSVLFLFLASLVPGHVEPAAPIPAPPPPPRHVVVLPIHAIGGDMRLEGQTRGFTEIITRRLSEFEGLNEELTVSPLSVVLERGVTGPVSARSKLGATDVVEGSLSTGDNQLRLVLTRIDTETQHQIESATVFGGDLGELESDTIIQLSTLLDLRVRPERLDTAPMLDAPLSAQGFYLRGLEYLQEGHETGNLHAAVDQFERAIEVDDKFAQAYAGLCDSYWRLYDRTADQDWVAKAAAECDRATELNNRSPEILITLGRLHTGTGKYERAINNFESALQVSPRNFDAFLGLARVYAATGRYDLAEATYSKAMSVREGDWQTYHRLGLYYFNRENFNKAAVEFAKVTKLTPESAQAFLNLGAALHEAGALKEARARYERSLEIERRPKALANLGSLLLNSGEYAEAAALYEEAVSLNPKGFGILGELASTYSHLGDPRATDTFLRAAQLAEGALQVNPKRESLFSSIAHYYAGANDAERALFWLAKARNRKRAPTTEELVTNAATCARIGATDQALHWVTVALKTGDEDVPEMLNKRPWLADLRAHPSFPPIRRAQAVPPLDAH